MNSSLRNLVDRIASLDDDTGFVDCTSIELEPERISIKIGFGEDKSEADRESWLILAKGVTAYKISHIQDFSRPTVETNHPVLMPHHLPHQALYFNTPAKNPDEVFAQLISAQISVTGSWFPNDFFLRRCGHKTLQTFLEDGFGLLAIGPDPVIDAFKRVLIKHEIEHSTLSWKDLAWNGSTHLQLNPKTSALVAHQSYVVAEDFVATRLEDTPFRFAGSPTPLRE